MKKLFIFFFVLTLINHSGFSQTIFGVKANPTLGFLRSSHLKESVAEQKNLDGLSQYNYHTTLRLGFGFGGYVEHYFTNSISGLFEPTINFADCRSFLNSSQSNLDSTRSGTINTIHSQADVHLVYFNLPVLFKYVFDHRNKFYAVAGPSVNLFFTPHILSKETNVTSSYGGGILDTSAISSANNKAKLNSFNKINLNLVLGVGKTFHLNGRGRDMNVEIRYNLPITHTSAFTNSAGFATNTFNNSVYSGPGKAAIEMQVPQYKLDNFRYSSFTISIGFNLYEIGK